MDNRLPKTKDLFTKSSILITKLSSLLGKDFVLTGKTRTDGANLRKLVFDTLAIDNNYELAEENEYQIKTYKGKGIPRILPEFLDTFIITNEKDYNMQVWNRIPNSNIPLIEYKNGTVLTCKDVRYLLVKITKSKISSILLLTADYIEKKFGKFGVPTIKHQLIISQSKRDKIIESADHIFFKPDLNRIFNSFKDVTITSVDSIHDKPVQEKLIKLDDIYEIFKNNIVNINLTESSTKNKGQELERIIAEQLGYRLLEKEFMVGGYPDIISQMLEIKVQNSPTVDLGKYTPEVEEVICVDPYFTTESVRYLIALTNEKTSKVEGAVICPGKYLGEYFTYVSDQSYKCQRNIPSSFFVTYINMAIFNPESNFD